MIKKNCSDMTIEKEYEYSLYKIRPNNDLEEKTVYNGVRVIFLTTGMIFSMMKLQFFFIKLNASDFQFTL